MRSHDPSSLDDPMLLLRCQAVDVHFLIDVLLAEAMQFRCDGCLDVIFGVLTEVIFIEVLKFDSLLDDVCLPEVVAPSCRCWWLLEVCHCSPRCQRGSHQEVLEVHLHEEDQ